jgi:hypothetical protein
MELAVPGDVVFLRGGVYRLDRSIFCKSVGTWNKPIIIESYPGELAIFDGSHHPYGTDKRLFLLGSYYVFRNVEVRNIPWGPGIDVTGSYNLIEGINSHHHYGSGIQIQGNGSFNTIRSSLFNDNSGAGILDGYSADGGNSDGISISSGNYNRVEHCITGRNSDDGIDTWKSTNTVVLGCISFGNGLGAGDGNGIKCGPGVGVIVERSISYQNRAKGLDSNDSPDCQFRYCTTWNNGDTGVHSGIRSITANCISSDDVITRTERGEFVNNSWQTPGSPKTVSFMNISPDSVGFLVPTIGSGVCDMGAYAV